MTQKNLGLLAYGRSNIWELSVDETTNELQQYFMELESRTIYLCFEIESPALVLSNLIALLESICRGKKAAVPEQILGTFNTESVLLMQDDEFLDRCFLVVGGESEGTFRFTLVDSELIGMLEAAKDVANNLNS